MYALETNKIQSCICLLLRLWSDHIVNERKIIRREFVNRANEMNWLDFESTLTVVKTPAFQDTVGVFQQNCCMKKKEFQEVCTVK